MFITPCAINVCTKYIFQIIHYVPLKAFGLIGWVDEVVVWIVGILGSTVQLGNVTAAANVQEQPARNTSTA